MEKEPKNKCHELTCPETDDYESDKPGVLLSHEISRYAKEYKMIDPFNSENLKPAGYNLSLGGDYAIGGDLKKLSPETGKNILRIPPFEVAIISTQETINLPRFIIARWCLRVKLIYTGLLWTGAPQVDPGWCGKLHCPIFNLSSEEVVLNLGDPIILIDFVKTTPFKKGESKEYPRPPEHKELKDYNWRLKSGLFTEVGERIDSIEKKVNRVESFIGLMLTCVAILFASLSIIVVSRIATQTSFLPQRFIPWLIINMGISITALFFAIYFRVKWEIKSRLHIMSIVYIFGAALLVYLLYPLLRKLIFWLGMVQQ